MSRFTLILTLAQQKRARAAERTTQAHVKQCPNCQAERPCADRKVLELVAEMHASTPVAQ